MTKNEGVREEKEIALICAARDGQLEEVQRLLKESQADVNASDYFGDTSLMRAAAHGHRAVVEYLTAQCADQNLNAKNERGFTALLWAGRNGQIDIARYLVEQGVEINAADKLGYTALMLASKFGHLAIVDLLVKGGADVDLSNELGYTSLMIAAGRGDMDVVKYLADTCNADVGVRSKQGETAVWIASDRGHRDIQRDTTDIGDSIAAAVHTPSCSIPVSEIELLDSSANANVGGEFRAKWLGADAVVKLFMPDASNSGFEEQVHLWQRLRHPHVMKMYGSCEAGPQVKLFVCEYASNGSLIEHVQSSSSVEKPMMWKFLYEAALGLEYLHERKIIHGDLRCSNILIGRDNLAKLSNFDVRGSGRAYSPAVVSMRWQSPEVVEGNTSSLEADLYSLGICILEAATGSIDQTVEHLKSLWSPESNVDRNGPGHIPDDACELIRRMCCYDPHKRASLSSVVYELERLANQESPNFAPEHEAGYSFDEYENGKKMWVRLQTCMKTCDDVQYRRAFADIRRVRDHLQDKVHSPTLLARFHVVLIEFYEMVKMSPEQTRMVRFVTSTRAITTALQWRINALLVTLGEAGAAKEREVGWQQQRHRHIELFMSGESDSLLLLQDLKSSDEGSAFLKTLKSEMEDNQAMYTPSQLGVMRKTFERLLRTLEKGGGLSELTPDWFIPWFKLVVDERSCLGGMGGFASVHQAKWLDSDVAVKRVAMPGSDGTIRVYTSLLHSKLPDSSLLASFVPDPTASQDDKNTARRAEARAMFHREVDIWFGLNHPHIVRLFGACHIGRPFFVCEFATNGTLGSYLRKNPDQLWSKLYEAALGVQYLHARNVVHGDLKGNNIVVGSDMKAKVTDFGLSSFADDEAKSKISAAWHWVAPECLLDASTGPTSASDVYSLGMCIVEALRVVEAVRAGNNTQLGCPWGNLTSIVVKYHATRGILPFRPAICDDRQWELVKRMCVLNPQKRIKISTVVEELARMEKGDDSQIINTSLEQSESVFGVIASMHRLLAQLQGKSERSELKPVLLLYVSLWDRFEQMHGQIDSKRTAPYHASFCSLVSEAKKATEKLQNREISLAEATLRVHRFDHLVDKLMDDAREDKALMWAVRTGELQSIRLIVEEEGVDVNAKHEDGRTALMRAAESGRTEVVQCLAELGAVMTASDDFGDTALMVAAEKGHMDVVRYITKQPGVDVNTKNNRWDTALMNAIKSGEIEIVTYLVENCGACVTQKNNCGDTPLLGAIGSGKLLIVQYLVEKCGADMGIMDADNNTVLMTASKCGHIELVRYFCAQHSVDITAKNDDGGTALTIAATLGCVDIFKYLAELQDAGGLNTTDELGNTALMMAARNGHIPIVRFLAGKLEVNVNAKNKRGKTALRLAADGGHDDIQRMLTPFLRQPVATGSAISQTDASSNYLINPSEIEIPSCFLDCKVGSEYRAKWLDADAVVKLYISDASQVTFGDEVHLWQQLRHPNVIKFYGACDAGPHLKFFIYEFANAGSLMDLVELSSMQTPTIWKFLYEAALGLEYLHERGVIHGDLRCSNILIGNDGGAKLSNFKQRGLATTSISGVWSVHWQSPEVLKEEPLSFASDVYSLGMCILEAVTREIPWRGESRDALEKYKERWTPEQNLRDDCDPDCFSVDARKLVWRACCQDPQQRANLSDIVHELERLVATKEDNSNTQPEHEPPTRFENWSTMQKAWTLVQTHMGNCDNYQYSEVLTKLELLHKQLKNSPQHAEWVESFEALLTEFYQMISMSPEQAQSMLRCSTRASTNRVYSLKKRIDSLSAAFSESMDGVKERNAQWQKQRTPIQTEESLKGIPEWFIQSYELIVNEWHLLGKGGYGSVYRARWLDSTVVVKQLTLASSDLKLYTSSTCTQSISTQGWSASLNPPVSLTQEIQREEAMTMFRREVDIWFGFSHPHVVQLFGACHIGSPFFVCEYATNGTLVKYLQKHPDEIWTKLHETALGVQYLHARKVVHGDLKGNNIVIGSDMKAKVTDFGLSSTSTDNGELVISAASHWVAPECLMVNAARPTFASDIYSLGMCIVEALKIVDAASKGTDPPLCLPWGILENFEVKFHVKQGTMPSQPASCDDDQWAFVKRMCVLDPKKRMRISTVVDELASLANTRHIVKNFISTDPATDLRFAVQVISASRELITRLQKNHDMKPDGDLLSLYSSLWDRLERVHTVIHVKVAFVAVSDFCSIVADADECTNRHCNATRLAVVWTFCSIVGDAAECTKKLQDTTANWLSSAEKTLQCYAFGRRLDKFEDAFFDQLDETTG